LKKTPHPRALTGLFKTALLVAGAASALVACGARLPSLSGLQNNQLGLPEAIRVPAGHQIALEAHGSGELLYTCQAIKRAPFQYAWLLQTSSVRLQDSYGRTINYYPGTRSRWVHSDGSQLLAQESVEAAGDGASLPQQRAKVEVRSAPGASGVLSRVSYVQTLRSVGGVVTTKPCVAGNLGMRVSVPLESDYVFWQPTT
jgi:Protein of unknown function (DUF3455)